MCDSDISSLSKPGNLAEKLSQNEASLIRPITTIEGDEFALKYLLDPEVLYVETDELTEEEIDPQMVENLLNAYRPAMYEYASSQRIPQTPVHRPEELSFLKLWINAAIYADKRAAIETRNPEGYDPNSNRSKAFKIISDFYRDIFTRCVVTNLKEAANSNYQEDLSNNEQVQKGGKRKNRRKKTKPQKNTTIPPILGTTYNIHLTAALTGVHAANDLAIKAISTNTLLAKHIGSELNIFVPTTIIETVNALNSPNILFTLGIKPPIGDIELIEVIKEQLLGAQSNYLLSSIVKIFTRQEVAVMMGLYRTYICAGSPFTIIEEQGTTLIPRPVLPGSMTSPLLMELIFLEFLTNTGRSETLSAKIMSTYPESMTYDTETDKERKKTAIKEKTLQIYENSLARFKRGLTPKELLGIFKEESGNLPAAFVALMYPEILFSTDEEWDSLRITVDWLQDMIRENSRAPLPIGGCIYKREGKNPNPHLAELGVDSISLTSGSQLTGNIQNGVFATIQLTNEHSLTFYLSDKGTPYLTNDGLYESGDISMFELNIPTGYSYLLKKLILEHIAAVKLGPLAERSPNTCSIPSTDSIETTRESCSYLPYHLQTQRTRKTYTEAEFPNFCYDLERKGYYLSDIVRRVDHRIAQAIGQSREISPIYETLCEIDENKPISKYIPKIIYKEDGTQTRAKAKRRYTELTMTEFAEWLYDRALSYLDILEEQGYSGIKQRFYHQNEKGKYVLDSIILRFLMTDYTIDSLIRYLQEVEVPASGDGRLEQSINEGSTNSTQQGRSICNTAQIHLNNLYFIKRECKEVALKP